MIAQSADAFCSPEALARGRRHCLSQLVSFGRRTVTGLLRNQDRTQTDWTADYRFYGENRFDARKLFSKLRAQVEALAAEMDPLVVAMDDSILRKTGRKIYGSRWQRDPMSPPFTVNFVRGLRVLQISGAVRQGTLGAARMVPIDFEHAALPAKPNKRAPEAAHEAYRLERAKANINLVGRDRLLQLRTDMDAQGAVKRQLIATIDGRFTNSTVLKEIPERTTLIGRVRRDSAFYYPPEQQPDQGRKRKYGLRCPTPEELLADPQIPWQTVNAYFSGQCFDFQVKTLSPVHTAMNKAQKALRVVAIKGVPYHLSKVQKDRREPAFLICTDPDLPLEQVLQYYLWRWDIEVNFRDEKTILGVGQAQVRSQASNQNAPALAVAAYSMLLLASIKTYGASGRPDTFKQPRWYKRKPTARATTNQLINQVRFELWGSALKDDFRQLSSSPPSEQNGIKCEFPLESAIFMSIN